MRNKDRFKVIAIIVGSITMLLGIVAYVIVQGDEPTSPIMLLTLIIALLIGIFALYFGYIKYREVKTGEVISDERTKIIVYRAGYFAALATMYWLLFLMYTAEDGYWFGMEVDIDQILGIAIIGMCPLFLVSYVVSKFRDA